MKPTHKRLAEVYCRPTTEEEWNRLSLTPLRNHYVMWLGGEPTTVGGEYPYRTEIPVPHFLDLIHDRIVPWRLEEDGFKNDGNGLVLWLNAHNSIHVAEYGIYLRLREAADEVEMFLNGIKTYTDLINLVRLIG